MVENGAACRFAKNIGVVCRMGKHVSNNLVWFKIWAVDRPETNFGGKVITGII